LKKDTIKILSTDFENKTLIIYDENLIFYCNPIGKYIFSLYKLGLCINKISELTNIRFNTDFTDAQISNFIETSFSEKAKQKKSYKKLIVLFDSNKIFNIKLSFIKNNYLYFVSFICILIINIYYSIKFVSSNLSIIGNIFVFIFFLLILILHELGHAVFAKTYNISPGKIGIGWYSLFPVFYINLNEIWRLEGTKRIIINLGGIYTQLVIGCLLVMLYMISDLSFIVRLIKLNVSTLIINLNPFIKFDGHWVLSDLLNDKDLQDKSSKTIKQLFKFQKPNQPISIIIYSIGRFAFLVFAYYLFLLLIIKSVKYLWMI
jgi:putative peptide zinc metalloprotease protein